MKRNKLLSSILGAALILAVLILPTSATDALIPGGMPFGVKLYTEGVLVVGFGDVDADSGPCNPAHDAGIRVKDVITHLDGKPLSGIDALTAAIDAGSGAPITLTYTRGSETYTATVTPVRSTGEDRFKTGMWVRDSGAGIGTVTYIDPETGAFGGLGHGICDIDTGELMPMQRGCVVDVTITGVKPGKAGEPGELRGSFSATKRGALIRNTNCGVYGVFSALPESAGEAIPVGTRDTVHAGPATLICTLDETGPTPYTVELSQINRHADGPKCFVIRVTDQALLARTGGIVQGLSGSPIIQDGHLIGAATHVLINQPDTGYGIFIENMLSAADATAKAA